MLYAISAQENVNVNPSLLVTHMYAASRVSVINPKEGQLHVVQTF